MKKQDLETIRENTNRTVLMMINEISKFFEDEMIKNKDFAILKDKTARHILSHLSSNDGATQQELVVVSQMKGSTVSVAVRKLETEGYLQRETNEYDMRSVKVYLTKKGRESHHCDEIKKKSRLRNWFLLTNHRKSITL